MLSSVMTYEAEDMGEGVEVTLVATQVVDMPGSARAPRATITERR